MLSRLEGAVSRLPCALDLTRVDLNRVVVPVRADKCGAGADLVDRAEDAIEVQPGEMEDAHAVAGAVAGDHGDAHGLLHPSSNPPPP